MNWKLGTVAVLALSLVVARELQAGAQQADCCRAGSAEFPPVWFARISVVEQAIAARDGVRAAGRGPMFGPSPRQADAGMHCSPLVACRCASAS